MPPKNGIGREVTAMDFGKRIGRLSPDGIFRLEGYYVWCGTMTRDEKGQPQSTIPPVSDRTRKEFLEGIEGHFVIENGKLKMEN